MKGPSPDCRDTKKGEWSPLMVGLIVALLLLGIMLYLWLRSGSDAMDWVKGLFDLSKGP